LRLSERIRILFLKPFLTVVELATNSIFHFPGFGSASLSFSTTSQESGIATEK
jgi:hypothetical protein